MHIHIFKPFDTLQESHKVFKLYRRDFFGGMMNLGKGFGAAKIPVIILVVLAALSSVIGIIPVVGPALTCILGLPMFVINVALYFWLGYLIYKAKLEIVDAALVGGITAAIAAVLSGVISFIANMLGLTVGMATGGTDMFGAAFGAGIGVIAIIFGAIIGFVIGLILAVIGYFLGSVLKK